jgi:thiamine pyrophosphokinase
MRTPSDSAFLLCNGAPPAPRRARRLRKQHRLFIAADGGANAARTLGLRPDVVIGDLDSITPDTAKAFHDALILRVERQDNTDMEKALDFCIARGLRRVVISGVTGGRIDMTLGNVFAAWRYISQLDLTLAGNGWNAFPLAGSARFTAPVGTTVSLIPFGEVRGLTLRGLKYPLRNATLRPGTIAVSNVSVRTSFAVSARKGNLLVIVLDERSQRVS